MRHRSLSIVGLIVLGAIAYSLIRGNIELDDAGIRAAVVFVCLIAVDRFVMPIVGVMIGEHSSAGEASSSGGDAARSESPK